MDTKQDSSRVGQEKDRLLYGRVEAQWVLACLDECATKLTICSYLTPEILQTPQFETYDHHLRVALQGHFLLEKKYINFQRHKEEGKFDDSPKLQEELWQLVVDSTRTVCMLLSDPNNSMAVRHLRDICMRRSPSALEYLKTFEKLRRLVHAKLKMTAEEERAIQDQLEELDRQRIRDDKKLKELQGELTTAIKDHAEAMVQKDFKIDRLRKQIQSVAARTEQARKDLKDNMAKQESINSDEFKKTKKELSTQLEALQKKLADDSKRHWDEEKSKHTKTWTGIRSEAKKVNDAIEKYDTSLKEKHEALKALEKQYKREQKELKRLREDYRVVTIENRKVEAEIERIKETRGTALVDERKSHHASVLMQSLFKQHLSAKAKALKAIAKAKKEAEKGKKK